MLQAPVAESGRGSIAPPPRLDRNLGSLVPVGPRGTVLLHLKDLIIGPALPTQASAHTRLDKVRALAAFSPGALASIAYANQEIYLGLVVAGTAGLGYIWPISLAIAGVLAIVALSYFQTIHAYPSGGGSYAVARANLGDLAGLFAASALLIDYLCSLWSSTCAASRKQVRFWRSPSTFLWSSTSA
jgi:hypothetical protein